jgi:peptide/nickel transport system permease protein
MERQRQEPAPDATRLSQILAEDSAGRASARSQSTWALAWRRFRRHKLAIAASLVISLLVLCAVLAPWIAPYDPTAIPEDLVSAQSQWPNAQHWLGTDELGRDVLSRILYGTRISLLVGFMAAISSVFIGTIMGTLAGYFSGRPFRFYRGPLQRELGESRSLAGVLRRAPGWMLFYLGLGGLGWLGWVLASDAVVSLVQGRGASEIENLIPLAGLGLTWLGVGAAGIWGLRASFDLDLDVVISRLVDFLLTVPTLPLLLVLSAYLRDPNALVGQWAGNLFGSAASVFVIISIIVLFGWLTVARLVRGTILSLREQEFTSAAMALGASEARIMFRHLLPNAMAPIIVQATLQVGGALLTEAALSFLGFGIQPPVATWGNMLTGAQENILSTPYLAIAPGCMILITVLAFNYLGDGLRDALDPRSRL